MKSFAVIGLGRFGTQLAKRLYENGADVLAIDTDASKINKIADDVTRAVIADAKDKTALTSLGIKDCDCVVVAIGSQLSESILITMNLKALGVPQVVCKAHDSTHREILEKIGADRVIIPERTVADDLANTLTGKNILEYIDLSGDFGVVELNAPDSWVGKSLKDVDVRAEFGVTVIAVRDGEKISVSPSARHKISKDTVLVLLGDYNSINKIGALD